MGRGRPAHKPTDETRTLVRRLAGMATPHDAIANFVAISDITLRRYYRLDLDRGRAEANLKVVQALFRAATREENPSVVAQMFWLKNRAGWQEAIAPADADAIATLQIEFVGPRAIVDAVRATQGPVINGEAQAVRTVRDVEPDADEDAGIDADPDADADTFEHAGGDTAEDNADPPGMFEVTLPEEDDAE